ncbi:MAG: molybdopterin-dependent oxidoreductase, partial [Myxococcaceae bacterium]|nr:molybdopterin-dependent oxidoreductase [Myxococcaceae bacterium]
EGTLTGLDELRRLAAPFTPEAVAPATGIAAEVTRRLAARLVSTPRAVVYGRMGTSVQPFGAQCAWLITALNVVTGHLDVPGGAMFPMPAFDPRWLPRPFAPGPGSHGRRATRVRGLPEVGGEFPVAALAEELLTDGPGRVRGLVTLAGNPVLSTPNGAQLDRALAGLEVMVSIDPYLNETSRHAHLVLPPPSPLERPHFDVVFPMLAVRDVVRDADALFDPGPAARHDWQLLVGLGRRLEALRGAGLVGRAKWAALERLGPRGLVDVGLRLGRRGGPFGLTLAKVAAAPHGLDLGPLTPALPEKLRTADRRLHLSPPKLVADVPRLAALLEAPRPPLVLINRRHLRDNNSWLHNADVLVKGPNRCTLLMHPDDARARGLEAGQPVRVTSRVGAVVAPLEVTAAVMPGVVSLPHGYGHGREGVRLSVAAQRAGVSVNDLSDELRVDPLSGNAAFSGVPVEVEAAPEVAPQPVSDVGPAPGR